MKTKFLIQKLIEAEDIQQAFMNEHRAVIFNVQRVVPESQQLSQAIGFDISVPEDED